MSNLFSDKSIEKLAGVDPRLIALAKKGREIAPYPFEISEGLRSLARQKYLVDTGKSRTMKSRHLVGKAFDFVAMPGGKVSWELARYKQLVEEAFKPAAQQLGLPVPSLLEFGCYWKSIVDGPHVQLND